MKLHYYKHRNNLKNFGDDMNPWLWGELIPDLLTGEAPPVVFGAGTLLNSRNDKFFPPSYRRIVMGSGYGYGSPPERGVGASDWDFRWVRGPLTAKSLGLEDSVALSDPGLLIGALVTESSKRESIGLMVHVASAVEGDRTWREVAEELGWTFIDPRCPATQVIASINSCSLIITEALHGAIVADALRVEWIPFQSNQRFLPSKWLDWAASVEVDLQINRLPQAWNVSSGLVRWARNWTKRRLLLHHLHRLQRHGTRILSNKRIRDDRIARMIERIAELRRENAVKM